MATKSAKATDKAGVESVLLASKVQIKSPTGRDS